MGHETFALVDGGRADSGPNGRNGGRFGYSGGNEVGLDAYDDDAVMYRRGGTVRGTGGGGGADSWDHLPNGPGGRRVQMVLAHGEQSEMVRGQPGNPQGSIKWQLNDGDGEADGNMKTAFQLEARSGVSTRNGSPIEAFTLGEPQWESLVRQLLARIAGVPVPAPPSGFPNKLVSPDGLVELDIQNLNDLNMTLYARETPDAPATALWSVVGGVTPEGRRRGLRG